MRTIEPRTRCVGVGPQREIELVEVAAVRPASLVERKQRQLDTVGEHVVLLGETEAAGVELDDQRDRGLARRAFERCRLHGERQPVSLQRLQEDLAQLDRRLRGRPIVRGRARVRAPV